MKKPPIEAPKREVTVNLKTEVPSQIPLDVTQMQVPSSPKDVVNLLSDVFGPRKAERMPSENVQQKKLDVLSPIQEKPAHSPSSFVFEDLKAEKNS
jgi:hypothetical protein